MNVTELPSYRLPPPPHLAGVADQWRLDPVMLVVLVVAAAGYLAGLVRLRRAGVRWPASRSVAFFALALPSLAVVSMGWPNVYARALFSVYAVQVMTLLMVVPFLLALGHPLGLARAALRPAGLARLDAVLASRPARFFTVPVVSPILLAVVPFVLYFTGLYPLSLHQPVLLSALHLALLLVGLAVLVPMWEAETIGARWPYALVLLFAFIELLVDAVPGIVIRLQTHPLAASWFAALGRPWGGSPLHDQQLGGDVLWCVGEAIDIPFLALLVIQWVRSDARDAARPTGCSPRAQRAQALPRSTRTMRIGPGGNVTRRSSATGPASSAGHRGTGPAVPPPDRQGAAAAAPPPGVGPRGTRPPANV